MISNLVTFALSLLLPVAAVQSRDGKTVVLQRRRSKLDEVRYQSVQTGLQDEAHIEILAGLSDSAVVLLADTSFVLPGKKGGSNPFMPQRNRAR